MSMRWWAAYRPNGHIWRVKHCIEAEARLSGPVLELDGPVDQNAFYVKGGKLKRRPIFKPLPATVKAGHVVALPGAHIRIDGEPVEDFDGLLEFDRPGVYRVFVRDMPRQDFETIVTVLP